MNYRMTALLKKLVDDTFDPILKTTCRSRMADALCLSENRIRNKLNQEDILFDNAVKMFDYLGYEVYAQHDDALISLTTAEKAMKEVNNILRVNYLTKVELANRLKVTYVAVMQFFKQPNMKSRTLVKIFNALDYQVTVKPKSNSGKTYVIDDDDVRLYQGEVMYKEALETVSHSSIKQESFFDRFIQDCIASDWESVETVSDLYHTFQTYWFSHPEHPTRFYLGKTNFRKLLVGRFNISGETCYGIKLKREAI